MMNEAGTITAAAAARVPAPSGRILCVDDEPSILSALRRLLRTQRYDVLTAGSGRDALEILATQPVDLVISDMRMPEMDGAQLLERIRAEWPDTVRLLLTGYADIQSILSAINRGEILRYITKPWDDNDILLIVRHAIERKLLEAEKNRLEALTRRQNDELKLLNASLETKVEQRTLELRQAHDELVGANDKLKKNFITSIKVFSNLIEMRGDKLAGHSRRVADLGRKLAVRLDMGKAEAHEVLVAGLLHNIGKIGFSDELLAMPVSSMKGDLLNQYRNYPAIGESTLMPLEDLRGAAGLVRHHQERHDGDGFPDRLAGAAIPLGARLLAVASDYDNLQIGTFVQRPVSAEEALALIVHGSGQRYDPRVVDAFTDLMRSPAPPPPAPELAKTVTELKPGMVIVRDLVSKTGFLLLSADHVLSERLIGQLATFEKASRDKLTVYVRGEQP
jgi:response regulator RpfG family c-di-GMP phosphodiesterase